MQCFIFCDHLLDLFSWCLIQLVLNFCVISGIPDMKSGHYALQKWVIGWKNTGVCLQVLRKEFFYTT